MNATRILWGQVIAVISVTLLGIWSATQWTAHALAYQPELGQPWFWLGPWPIYPPYAFFWWWFAFDAYAPKIFQTGAFIAVSGAMAAIVIAIAMSVWRAREEKQSETYGSARWATDKEITDSNNTVALQIQSLEVCRLYNHIIVYQRTLSVS